MWKKKPKFKEIDETMLLRIKHGCPGGVHVKDIIRVDSIRGKMHIGGFVPDKFQPKPIYEILSEQRAEKRRNSRT